MPRLEPHRLHEGIRRYERNIQYQILCHLDSLNVHSSRDAWTTRISQARAAELAERAKNPPLDKGAPIDETYRQRKSIATFKRVGSTVAVKDNIVTSSPTLPNSAASNILRGYVAPEPATIISLMEDAGLMILGKTNMDEFGMGSHSQYSAFGPVRNARNPSLSVGGSSGGSAELVARGMVHYGIGTDTGGSVRLPASYLNIVGFKPSYGCISRYGVIPYANSLDTVGLFATSCLDLDPLFRVLSQPDPKDPTCLSAATRARMQQLRAANNAPQLDEDLLHSDHPSSRPQRQRRTLRIGVPREYNIAELQNGVREAWIRSLNLLAAQGHTIVPISLPLTQQALSAYYVLAPAEASSNLAKYDGVRYGQPRDETDAATEEVLYSAHRGQLFGEEVRRRILLGAYSLSAGAMDNFFVRAQKVRRLVQNDFNRVFRAQHPLLPHQPPPDPDNGVDYIVCPTAPTFPPKVDTLNKRKQADDDVDDVNDDDDAAASAPSPLEAYANDVLTVPASLAGLPAVSVPAPPPQDALSARPERAIGIQVIGQFGSDLDLLTFTARNLELTQDWSIFNNELPRAKL
ncbi:hypothetical protein DV738_g4773, partial [Chaetothyriales sp. CBS 135597]